MIKNISTLNSLAKHILVLITILCSSAHASVEAIVIVDKAIIWADVKRSAPLGYVVKGKTVTVGEVPRNKNQVIPIAVSGRIGYIAMDDISFADKPSEIPKDKRYERFKEVATEQLGQQVMFLATGFNSKESKNTSAGRTGQNWNFRGGTLKGVVPTSKPRLGIMFIGEYLYAENNPETFRVFEMGLGFSITVIDWRYFKLRAEAAAMAVPYVQYESDPLFTLNGYGLGGLAQGTVDIYFNNRWGIEGSLGIQAIKLYGIDRPSQFKDFDPFFSGTRMSLGVVYRF